MKLYAFPSKTPTNIWAGIGRGLWAVSHSGDEGVNKGRRTKAAKMPVGSFGLIYCSDTQSYSTPFVVLSRPQSEECVTDVWPGTWVLPFSMRPLGNPSKFIERAGMGTLLPTLQQNPAMNVDDLIQIRGVQTFNASDLSDADWAILIERLVV